MLNNQTKFGIINLKAYLCNNKNNNKMKKNQTFAQFLNIKVFPFEIKDKNGNVIYYEFSNGNWYKREYDSKGKEIYSEYSDGYWYRYEYDSKGNVNYFENSEGKIRDNRPKEIADGCK